MRNLILVTMIGLLAISAGHTAAPDWAINATAIEACSCPHFCMCYFNSHPAAHHDNGNHYGQNKQHGNSGHGNSDHDNSDHGNSAHGNSGR